jgi:hypothetical protein
MLCGGRGFGGCLLAIALVEAIDASGGIDQLLFSGKERVAGRANFDVQIALFGGAGLEGLAASAGNGDIDVFWVNSWFHLITLYRRPQGRNYKQVMIKARETRRQACEGSFTQRRKAKPQRRKEKPAFFALPLRLGAFA